jgi:hypothetical protein
MSDLADVESVLDGTSPAEIYVESLVAKYNSGSIANLIIQASIMLELKRIRKLLGDRNE